MWGLYVAKSINWTKYHGVTGNNTIVEDDLSRKIIENIFYLYDMFIFFHGFSTLVEYLWYSGNIHQY